jgi:TonB family protein
VIRGCLLIAFGLMVACASLFGQNSSSEPGYAADTSLPASHSLVGDGRYVSGFEVLNEGKNAEALGFYTIRILEAIRSKWYPQIPELQNSIGRKRGTAVIEFEIRRDGSLGKMKTVESAADASLDGAAAQAISSSAPFGRLPEAYREKALRLRMHFGFYQPGSTEAPFCDGPNWGAQTAAYVLHRVKDGVIPPKATYDREPEFPEQARRDKYSSVVHIAGTVDLQGAFTDLCVSEAAGEGLDEKAMEAVRTWKFEPATLRGEPVAVRINVEVSFRLY